MEFLKKTATYLIEQYPGQLNNICLVLPNRRSGHFLKKHFAALINKPIFLPAIISIKDFISQLSGLEMADDYLRLSVLYQAYLKSNLADKESFEEFIKWAPALLRDFEETDQYLADARQLFYYLNEEKILSLWDPEQKPLTAFQKNYLNFYNNLYSIYHSYTTELVDKGTGGYGMICRQALNSLQNDAGTTKFNHIIFCGLYALTGAEEKILDYYISKNMASVLWDADEYYTLDEKQEAGVFIRKYISRWPSEKIKWIDKNFSSTEKTIEIIGVSGNVTQVKTAASLIEKYLCEGQNSENIALILNDESLLMPVLNSLPDKALECNITMGFPLKLSPVFSITEALFNLQKNSLKFQSHKNSAAPLFFYRDIIEIISHPYLSGIFNINTTNIVSALSGNGKIFYDEHETHKFLNSISDKAGDVLSFIFTSWKNDKDKMFSCIASLIDFLRERFLSGNNKFEIEFLFHLHKQLNIIRDFIKNSDIEISPETIHLLLVQNLSSSLLPFKGEPLKGLQIMGLLESRALDFENIIMLSVNEGILPSSKSNTSFIPYDVRKAFGLPVYTLNDQVSAYHFYRSLQRCKNAVLCYNTQSKLNSNGEMSRFISQLVYEMPRYNPSITIKHSILSIPPETCAGSPLSFSKSEEVLTKLFRIADDKGFSPSALNTFRVCPVKYYLKYIAGLKEVKPPDDEIAADAFGSILHLILETLLKKYIKIQLLPEHIDEIIISYENTILDAINTLLPSKNKYELFNGKNYLIFEVLKTYIKDYLYDLKRRTEDYLTNNNKFSIADVEHELSTTLNITNNLQTTTVKIFGKIDMIEIQDHTTCIVDFKTSEIKDTALNLFNLFSNPDNTEGNYCFQTMMYLWLYMRNHPDISNHSLLTGIISFRRFSEGYKNVIYSESRNKKEPLELSKIDAFEEFLNKLISRIFDTSESFRQSEDIKACEYCSYKIICNK